MKRILIVLAGAVLLMTAASCTKEKTCRCSVRGTSTVRIIKISKGECNQLSHLDYHTPLDVQVTDSLICTDYEFRIDSIYND